MSRKTASARMRRAVHSVIEHLEDRRLLAGDPLAFQNVVQTLPFALNFNQQVNGVFDASGQSIGFTRVQVNRLGTQYQPSLLNLNTAAGELNVTTTGNATSGSNYGTDNTQVDALETQFAATTSGFTITARLKGPLTSLAAAYDGAGVYFGPDQDNYVKLVAEYDATRGQTLQFTDEQSATIHTVNVFQNIGSFSAINTLDLRLTGDAGTDRVTGSYSINGGAFTSLGQFLQLTGAEAAAFFNSAGRAGVMAAQKNNLAPITVAFSHFEIDAGAAVSSRPTIIATNPSNGQTGVPLDASISADLNLPNAGLDPQTLSSSTVQLFRTSDHATVPAVVNTSGGGDSIICQPLSNLAPNTTYTFSVTGNVKDTAGIALVPFTMTFTTGSGVSSTDPSLQFQKVSLPTATGAPFTCVRMGPDGKLYASSEDGRIFRWTINADGTLGTPQIIMSLQAANGGPRLVTGFAFDPSSTATDLILWVSNGYFATQNAPDWTGKITVMSGPDLGTVQDAVINLPRSSQDHLTEQPTFGPDGALYIPQGSNTAMGAPDITWGMRPEHLLNAAILRLDITKITPGQPLDVKTIDGGGTYNPFAVGAPLTLYATGVRNAFSLLWTADGMLYAPTNGSSAGGNTPAFPNSVNGNRIDTGQPYNGPAVPGLTDVPQTEPDWLYKITQGGYYGHPDPARGEFVLDGGNPTAGIDPNEVPQYPVGTQPDANYRGFVYNFGAHRSPDGIIEYQDKTFGGRLQGTLMVVEESAGADIVVLTRDASGNIVSAQRGIPGLSGFRNALNLVEDPNTGNIYVAELGGMKLTLLRPVVPHATATPSKSLMVFNDIQTASTGGTGPSPSQTLTITNTGTVALTFPSGAFQIANDPTSATQDAASFAITNLSSIPATVAPGQSVNLTINFTASSVGIKAALIQISSNDPSAPVLTVKLHGIGTTGTGGTNEPSLARILRAYNIPTIVGDGPNDANQGFTLYPNPPDPSSQEVVMQRLVKAGDGPVTITPLAVFAVSNQPTLRFGYYTPGNPNDRNELFSIKQSDAQTVNPTAIGATSFDPGSSAFGLYSVFPTFTDNGHQRISYSEDAFNTWDTAVQRKVRFFPLENPDGSIVPNAYIFTAEDWNVQYDSNDIVGIIRNVQAAPAAPAAPQLGLENLDVLPASDRMIFNRIQNPNTALPGGADIVHDTGTLRLHNTGGSPLVINGITVNGSWLVTNMPAAGASIAPGGTLDLTVKFIATGLPPSLPYNETNDSTAPNGGGVWNGSLVINSNDPNQPAKTVTLAGWWQNQSEHENEPGLQTIVNLLAGWQTIISNQQQPNYPEGATTPTYYGEEVVSAFWQRADTSLPVTVRQLDAFHQQIDTTTTPNQVTSARVGWYPQGATLTTWLYGNVQGEGQSLLPQISGSNAQAVGTFNPSGIFGINLDGNYSDDTRNTVGGGGGHHVRFYPLRDSSGNLVPNTWIVALDYGSTTFENYDFQDNVYIISNMRPTNAPPAPTDAFATASAGGGVTVQWAAVTDSTLAGYNIYRSTSPTGTFLKVNTSPVTATSFVDQYASSGVTTYYRVTAVDGSGESSGASASALAVPAAPTSLTATAVAAGQIRINWTAPAGNVTYRLERVALGGSGFVEIASGLTTTSFLDSNLLGGTTYVYQVRAENSSGLSPYSAIATATTPAGAAPSAPTSLVSSFNSSGQVALSWAASTGIVTAYHVERSAGGGAFVEIAGNVQGLSFTDTTAAPSTAYAYRVRAENAGAYSGYSATSSITTPVGAPTGLTAAVIAATSVQLNWTAPAGTVTAYHVERALQGGAFAEITSSGTLSGTSFVDPTAQAGATYVYRVRAENSGSFSAYSNQATVAIPAGPPAAPTNLVATATGSNSIALSWAASAQATGYIVQRMGPTDTQFQTIATTANANYTDSAVQSATSYAYQVLAQNAAGTSPPSATATAATPSATFQSADINATPAGTTTVVTDGSAYNVTAGGIDIGGSADSFRFLYQLRSGDFDAILQVQGLNQVAVTTKAGIMVRASLNPNDLMIFSGATAADGYRFSARTAVGAASSFIKAGTVSYPNVWVRLTRVGNVFTGYSSPDGHTWTQTSSITLALPSTVYFGLGVTAHDATGTATTTAQLRNFSVSALPAAPTNLSAAGVSPTEIDLSWSPVPGAASYTVLRKGPTDASYVQIATGVTGASYANTGLSANTTYSYEVIATNSFGSSPASNPATATTAGAPAAPSNLVAQTASSSSITLTWTAPGGAVSDYRVYRMGPADSTFVLLPTVVTGTSYTDTGLSPNTTYQYQVIAENAAGSSPASNTASATTSTATPSAPTNLAAAANSSSQVTLTWTASIGAVTAYHVERNAGSGFVEIAGNVQGTSFIDTGLQANTPYTYRVRAENTGLFSAYSGTAQVTTPQQQPTDPFTSQDIGAAQPGSTTMITPGVDYNVVGGGPAIYGTADGFRFVYQPRTGDFDIKVQVQSLSISSGGTLPQAGLMARETLDPGSPDVFIGASLSNGYRFKYRTTPGGTTTGLTAGTPSYPNVFVRLVRSGSTFTAYYSADGTNWTRYSAVSESLPSTIFVGMAVVADSATTMATAQLRGYGPTQQVVIQPPAAPASLTATAASPTQVNLSWAAVSGATSYHVERATSGGSFVEIASNVTATTYSDLTAQAGTTYQYRVRAQNSAGLGAYSPLATVTTPTATPVDPLTSQDIGASLAGSTNVITPGSDYDMTAGGPAIYGTADGFRFASEQITGDFDLKVRINSMTVAGAIAQAGLMARATLDAGSAEVAVTASPANGYRFKYRTTAGGATTPANTIGTCTYPNVWVRLKRSGNVFTGYFSTDGVTWTTTGSVTLALPSTVYVGLAAASNDTTDLTTVQFRGFGNT